MIWESYYSFEEIVDFIIVDYVPGSFSKLFLDYLAWAFAVHKISSSSVVLFLLLSFNSDFTSLLLGYFEELENDKTLYLVDNFSYLCSFSFESFLTAFFFYSGYSVFLRRAFVTLGLMELMVFFSFRSISSFKRI